MEFMNDLKLQLTNHVKFLSMLGEKSIKYPSQLQIAKDYIIGNFGKENIQIQQYICSNVSVCNVELTLEGAYNDNEIIIVGAHYDTIHNGANDNCSGIACLLELAELFKTVKIDKNFMTSMMGSKMYAKMCKERKDNIKLALIMDLVGYYTDEPNTQTYPFNISYLPTTGNFICFTGQNSVRKNMKNCVDIYKQVGNFPIQGLAFEENEFASICSDHKSFCLEGYPAFLVTDTAFLRYPYYHTEEDTPDKLNYDKMADMTLNLFEMLKKIVGVVK
jgi:Zn-dependent M28 family amino/carboxypeptidase